MFGANKAVATATATGLTYVGGASTAGAGSASTGSISLTSLSGGVSTSPAAGDLIVVSTVIASTVAIAAGIASSGYTQVANLTSTDTYVSNMAVAYKLSDGTETSISTNASGSTSEGVATIVHVWRGVNQLLPIDAQVTTATAINTRIPNPAAITPNTAGCVILAFGMSANNAGSPTLLIEPAGTINAINVAGAGSGSACKSSVYAYNGWTSGSYDPPPWTGGGTSTSNDSSCAVTFAIRPAGSSQIGPVLLSAASTQNTVSSTSLTINRPGGTRQNDLLVAFLLSGGGTQGAGGWSSTGWTFANNLTGGNNRPFNAIAYKIVGAGEASSYTFTAATSRTLSGSIIAYRNAAYDTVGTATDSTNPLVLPSITVSDFSTLIGIGSRDTASITVTGPSTMQTVVLDNGGNTPSYLISQETPEASGSVGTRSFTVGATTNVNGCMVSVKPSASLTSYGSFVASTTAAANASVTSLAVNTSACVTGNLLVMAVSITTTVNAARTVTTPTGWTLLTSASTTDTSYRPGLYIYYRVADGTEASSYTVSVDALSNMAISMTTVAGTSPSTLTHGGISAIQTGTDAVASAVTAATNGFLLYIAVRGATSGTGVTFTPPSGMTEAVDFLSDSSSDITMTVAYQEQLSAGSTGSKTATTTTGGYLRSVLLTVNPK